MTDHGICLTEIFVTRVRIPQIGNLFIFCPCSSHFLCRSMPGHAVNKELQGIHTGDFRPLGGKSGSVMPLYAVYVIHATIWSICWWQCVLFVPSVLWYCWLGLLTCKNRLPYNLYCVGGDVKHCSIQSNCDHSEKIVVATALGEGRAVFGLMRCCVYRRNSTWSGWQRWSWPVEVEQWLTRRATRPNNTPFDHFFDFITTAPPHRPHGRRQRPYPRHQLRMAVNVSVSLYKTWSPRGTVTGCVTNRCVWRHSRLRKTVCFVLGILLHTQRLLKHTEDTQRIYKDGCKWTCYKGFRYTLKLEKPRCIRDSMKSWSSSSHTR